VRLDSQRIRQFCFAGTGAVCAVYEDTNRGDGSNVVSEVTNHGVGYWEIRRGLGSFTLPANRALCAVCEDRNQGDGSNVVSEDTNHGVGYTAS